MNRASSSASSFSIWMHTLLPRPLKPLFWPW